MNNTLTAKLLQRNSFYKFSDVSPGFSYSLIEFICGCKSNKFKFLSYIEGIKHDLIKATCAKCNAVHNLSYRSDIPIAKKAFKKEVIV